MDYEGVIRSGVPNCSCEKCVNMCKTRPCWGSPRQFKQILVKHPEYVDMIGIDYYLGEDSSIYMLAGSIPDCDSDGHYPYIPVGTCGLLKDDKCLIHEMKPVEGRMAHHDDVHDQAFYKWLHHTAIPSSWKTKKGLEVIDLYRRLRHSK